MLDLANIVIHESTRVRSTLQKLDSSSHKFLLVCNDNSSVIGTVTDGDIRRYLISSTSGLDSEVRLCMNQEFLSIRSSESKNLILKNALESKIRYIPVLDQDSKLLDLIDLNNYNDSPSYSNPVLIMAGGKGSRMRSLTQNCPKPMLPINGKPMLESIIEDCIKSGFRRFFISVNYLKESIINYFGDGHDLGIVIDYLVEDSDNPLGTAGSLGLLPQSVSMPILVMNGDIKTHVCFSKVLDFHNSNYADMTVCAHQHSVDIPFGVIETKEGLLRGIEEKPSYSFLVNAGIYVVSPSIFKSVSSTKPLDMTQLIDLVLHKDLKIVVCSLHDYWIDVGRPEDYEKVQIDYAKLNRSTF